MEDPSHDDPSHEEPENASVAGKKRKASSSSTAAEKSVCIVTGANTGIGKETTWGMLQAGFHVVMACRSKDRAQDALDELQLRSPESPLDASIILLDLSKFESILSFVSEFQERFSRLDVLINNAGVVVGSYHECEKGFELMWSVNHLGHFLLTDRLLPTLRRSAPSRIVIVASAAHKFAGPLSIDQLCDKEKLQTMGIKSSMTVYGRTKLCNMLHTISLHARLQEEGCGVTVNSLHPGTVNTDLQRDTPAYLAWIVRPIMALIGRSPSKGAQTTLHVATSPELDGVSGKYFDDNSKEKIPEAYALDVDVAEELWEYSMQCVEDHIPTETSRSKGKDGKKKKKKKKTKTSDDGDDDDDGVDVRSEEK